MKSVCVLGKGTVAIAVAEMFLNQSNEFLLAGVIPVFPEPTWTDSFESWARTNNVPIIGDNRGDKIVHEKYDLGFSCFFDKILSPSDISQFELLLNLHNGPLPKYRGSIR